jgi:hypothetical protein
LRASSRSTSTGRRCSARSREGVRTARTWFGIHLLISGAFGVGYDAGFARLRSSDVKTGVLLSPAHFLVSGTFFAALDRLHPLVPGTFRDPGPFFTRFGVRGVALLLATKIAFGASVAALEQRFA